MVYLCWLIGRYHDRFSGVISIPERLFYNLAVFIETIFNPQDGVHLSLKGHEFIALLALEYLGQDQIKTRTAA